MIARETLHFKNKGSKAVNKVVLCQSADLAPNRAFYEVRSQTVYLGSCLPKGISNIKVFTLLRAELLQVVLSLHMQVVQGTTEDAPELMEVGSHVDNSRKVTSASLEEDSAAATLPCPCHLSGPMRMRPTPIRSPLLRACC